MKRSGRDKSREGTRFGREGKLAYGKRNVWHCKESGKGVEELAEDSPFPLAPEKRDLRGKGVIRLWDECAVGEGSGSGGCG